MSFNTRMTARAEALINQLGEAGALGTGTGAQDCSGVFQWSWVVDPVSGVTMERQMARTMMLTTGVESLSIGAGDVMEWRGATFRVQGLLPNDAGITIIEMARLST